MEKDNALRLVLRELVRDYKTFCECNSCHKKQEDILVQAEAEIKALLKPMGEEIGCKHAVISHGINVDGEVTEAKVHCPYTPEIDYTVQLTTKKRRDR